MDQQTEAESKLAYVFFLSDKKDFKPKSSKEITQAITYQ